MNTLGKIII